MYFWRNPIVIEGYQTYFTRQAHLSRYLNYLIFLAALLFLTWPKSSFLRVHTPPFTYSVILVAMLIVLAYLAFSLGAQELSEEEYHTFWDWVTLTPLRVRTIVVGNLLLMLLHNGFFLLIALPILLAARNVSGTPITLVGSSVGMLLFFTLTYRLIGWCCLLQWEQSDFLSYLVVRILYIFFLFFTGFFLPALNPILALTSLFSRPEEVPVIRLWQWQIPHYAMSLLFHLFCLALVLSLIVYRLHRWKRSTQEQLAG